MTTDEQGTGFFWIGLMGIIATGFMVGVGGDNLWTLAYFNPPFGYEPHIIGKGHALLVVVGAMPAESSSCNASEAACSLSPPRPAGRSAGSRSEPAGWGDWSN
jgi:hypothetical protein